MSKEKSSPRKMLKLWERLELKLSGQNKDANFVTRVEDFDRDSIIVERPVRIAGKSDLSPGDRLDVSFNREDASYSFEAVTVAIDQKRENIVTLKAISELERSQRRRFVRIDIAGDIEFKVVETSSGQEPQLSLDKRGQLLNISAGGILLNTNKELKRDNIVLLNFSLKNSQRLENVLGLVKRSERSTDSDSDRKEYLAGIEFMTKKQALELLTSEITDTLPSTVNFFDEALQQVIVQFVYRQQVESRKREKVKS
jgi:c-di-GMP-binding flagellar brake protein YcgR